MSIAPKLTPEIQERICALIRAGNTIEVAAQATGIHRATFYNWKQRRPAFRAAVERAESEAEALLVSRIAKAATAGSWRAATWLLEHRYPERWADRTHDVDENAKPPTAAEQIRDELAARRAAQRSTPPAHVP